MLTWSRYQAGPLLRVVMSYVDSVMGGRGGRPDVRQLEQMEPHLKNSLTKFLKKLRVCKVVNGQKSRSRPIKALIMKGAQTKFEKDGVEITVEVCHPVIRVYTKVVSYVD